MSGTSLSFRLVLLVLKLKGVKKTFSKSPIDFIKLRKEDLKKPKGSFYKNSLSFEIEKSTITVVESVSKSDKLVLFIPGGAFVSGPAQHHWDVIKKINKTNDYNVWLCDYPKAPEHKITEISTNIDAVYTKVLESFLPENIIIIGDSVGATLGMALVQRLLKSKNNIPSKLILISPVMDASMSNPEIKLVDKKDPILSLDGVLSAKLMCADNGDLKSEHISPLYGSFKGFPETILFLAENDIMYPDERIFVEELVKENVEHKVFLGKGMPHIWPVLPFFKEGQVALRQLISKL